MQVCSRKGFWSAALQRRFLRAASAAGLQQETLAPGEFSAADVHDAKTITTLSGERAALDLLATVTEVVVKRPIIILKQ